MLRGGLLPRKVWSEGENMLFGARLLRTRAACETDPVSQQQQHQCYILDGWLDGCIYFISWCVRRKKDPVRQLLCPTYTTISGCEAACPLALLP